MPDSRLDVLAAPPLVSSIRFPPPAPSRVRAPEAVSVPAAADTAQGRRTPLAAFGLTVLALATGTAVAVLVAQIACGPKIHQCGSPVFVLGALVAFVLGLPSRRSGAMFVVGLTGSLCALDVADHLLRESAMRADERQLVRDLVRLALGSAMLFNAEAWTLGLYERFRDRGRGDGRDAPGGEPM